MVKLRLQQVGKGRYLASSVRLYMGGSTSGGVHGMDKWIVDDGGVECLNF
jgi:hypothetical protein